MKIIKTDKLSPCPFCGGEVELQDHTDAMYGFWDYKVKCKHCRTEMRSPAARERDLSEPGVLRQICNETTKRKALDKLIENWNYREEDLRVHKERLQA